MNKDRQKSFREKYLANGFVVALVISFLLNLGIETLARQSMPGYGGLYYMVDQPVVFLLNWLVIFSTLSVALLFRRRAFFFCAISLVWAAIGITNGVILTQRMTPFTMKDLSSMGDGATILTTYFSIRQIVLIAVLLVAVVAFFLILFIKGPKKKEKVNLKRNLAAVIIILVGTFGATYGLIQAGVFSTFFGNLAYAYHDYGVPYCFINTWLNQGVRKPLDYSEEGIAGIIKESKIAKDGVVKRNINDQANEEELPNIIFLQLESFVDPLLFNNIECSEDPIPNFRKLAEEHSAGDLTVPACGAGTANTEFETMTGFSVKFFGPGEYPFKSILKERPAESIVWDLKDMGYSTHAIHNHRAMFYNRHIVFDNIGFDTFTSVEYMSDVERTPKNWAKDAILTEQIFDALRQSVGRDYIYTISVQGHGKYPEEKLLADPDITVLTEDETIKNKYEYYVNEVREMDEFVGDITRALSDYEEPVVLVMYGDHIPALDISEDSYDARDLYQTEYVIWSNFPMKKKNKDLTTYELTSEVLERLDIHNGTTVRYHQNVRHKGDKYLRRLKTLCYDMYFGKGYTYGGLNPYSKARMKMGVKKIRIDSVVAVGGKYYIKGHNFTENSKVTLDGNQLKTIYLGPTLLGLQEEVDPSDASRMKVSQIDKSNDNIISTTE